MSAFRARRHESPIEELVADYLIEFGVGFRAQEPIGPYFADLFLPQYNLVIECDGRDFHQDKEREERRDDFIRRCGYRIVHLTGRQIVRGGKDEVFAAIKDFCPENCEHCAVDNL